MTDTTDTGGKMYSLAINAPQPLNITFTDGSQLIFPLSGKASFTGDVEESARVFFDAVIRHRDSQLEAERQRADKANRTCSDLLRTATDEAMRANKAEAELAALKGDQVPVAYRVYGNYGGAVFLYDENHDYMIDDAIKQGVKTVPLYDRPQKPVVLPHGHKPYLVRSQTTAPRAAMTANGDWLHRVQVVEAIEATGGIVKDGE